jgi:hypothetical protein
MACPTSVLFADLGLGSVPRRVPIDDCGHLYPEALRRQCPQDLACAARITTVNSMACISLCAATGFAKVIQHETSGP